MRFTGLTGKLRRRSFFFVTRTHISVPTRQLILLFFTLLLAALPSAAQIHPFYLHQNDRVIFYGDSITEQGHYTAFIENYVVTRFPDLNVRFVNSGWAGDWIVGGGGGKVDQRLARDVVAEKATVATFMLGMNDAAYQDYDPAFFGVYTKGYQHLLDSLRQSLPNLRITLLEPSPYDDVTRPPIYALHDGGYNKVIVRYGAFVRELAQQQKLDVVDLNAQLIAVLEKAHQSDPALAEKIIPDRIHPSAAGGLVMAAAILKAWNAPSIVSSVEIDASHSRVRQQQNTRVTDLRKTPTLSWTQQENALPMPFDPKDDALALVLRSSNIVESLDQQLLKVTGLPDAKYLLKIDDAEIAAFSREDLAQGINLALRDTPMLKQSLDVYAFSARLHSVRMASWQSVQVGLQEEASPHIAEATSALAALEDELIDQQKSTAAPKAHHYELLPQNSN
jgi:lysophospholipase L1-like esterase